jgi:hypothetical protein
MKFKPGDLVNPVYRRHRWQGGTLAIVLSESTRSPFDFFEFQLQWLNGKNAGLIIREPVDMFTKVSE